MQKEEERAAFLWKEVFKTACVRFLKKYGRTRKQNVEIKKDVNWQ